MSMTDQLRLAFQAVGGDIKSLRTKWAVDMRLAGCVPNDPLSAAINTAIFQASLSAGFPVYFPAGTYYLLYLNLHAHTSMFGDGPDVSMLSWVQDNMTTRANMFEAVGDVSSLSVYRLGFRGNRQYQTTPTATGHDLAGFSLRAGSVMNVHFSDVRMAEFGDDVTAGGGLLMGALSGSGKVIRNVLIEDVEFENIRNVPGVYINGDAAYHSVISDITIKDSVFRQGVSAHQNAIYVLGGSLAKAANGVHVTGNRFHVSQTIDTCAELNFINGFDLSSNQIFCSGDASCVGLLLREGVTNGKVAGNVLNNSGTGCANTHAIALTRLTSSGTQQSIEVANNIITGWAVNGSGAAIHVGPGSSFVGVHDNILRGNGSDSTARMSAGVSVSNAIRVRINDNINWGVSYPMILSGAVAHLNYEHNTLQACGDGAVGMLIDTVTNSSLTNIVIANNQVASVVPGTPSFVSMAPATKTQSRIENNRLPVGLNPVNPSFADRFYSVVTPPTTGAMLAGKVYQFTQGALDIASGSGYTIGTNLDDILDGMSASEVVFGDTVIATPPGSMGGASHTAYVDAANRIRIRVANATGAGVSVPAGIWRITVIKTSVLSP